MLTTQAGRDHPAASSAAAEVASSLAAEGVSPSVEPAECALVIFSADDSFSESEAPGPAAAVPADPAAAGAIIAECKSWGQLADESESESQLRTPFPNQKQLAQEEMAALQQKLQQQQQQQQQHRQ